MSNDTDTPEKGSKQPTFRFRPDELAAFDGTGHELIPLHAPDALDAKGRRIGKAPHRGWRRDRPLSAEEARQHMVEGQNVGVRLRPTDLVVDVDPRNFVPGDQPVRRLEALLGRSLDAWPTVVTGSGGRHHYMTVPEGFRAVDTLEEFQGVEFKAHGRQLVAPGSSHPDTGQPYAWLADEFAPTIAETAAAPDALLGLIRRPERVSAAPDAGELSPEQVEELLGALDPSQFRDQARWLELMMACHHGSAGEARDEFVAWSASDPAYRDDAWIVGRRWDSLHADRAGGVTVKTLYGALHGAGQGDALARVERGSAEDDFAALSDEDVPELPARTTKATAAAAAAAAKRREVRAETAKECARQLAQTLAYVHGPKGKAGTFYDRRTLREYSEKAFALEFQPAWKASGGRGKVWTAFEDGELGIQKFKASLCLPSAGEVIEVGEGYDADGSPIVTELYNTWRETGIQARGGDHGWFERHVRERMFPGSEEYADLFLDELGLKLLSPYEKIRHALLVVSPTQGVGKSALVKMFRKMVGPRYVKAPTNRTFQEPYQDWMPQAFWAVVEELGASRFSDKKELYNDLKTWITDDQLNLRLMWSAAETDIPSLIHFIFFTNTFDAMYIAPGDRRFLVLLSDAEKLPADEQQAYDNWLNDHIASDDDVAAVKAWLQERYLHRAITGLTPISHNSPPPMTEAKRDMIGVGQDDLDFALDTMLEQGTAPFDFELFRRDDVVAAAEGITGRPRGQVMALVDAWASTRLTKHRHNTHGRGLRLYSRAEHAAKWQAAGPKAREDAFVARKG